MGMSGRGSHGSGSRFGAAPLLALVMIVVPAGRASAQVLPAAAGAVGGLVAGVIVTTATVVLEARMGRYVYGLDELISVRPEVLPILIGPVAGAVLGARSPLALGRAGTGALLGIAGGIALGTGAGALIWSTSEGRWAGAIIGGAAGMLTGAVLYASLGNGDDGESPGVTAAFSIRVPWGR
jgi:hypothetical protein